MNSPVVFRLIRAKRNIYYVCFHGSSWASDGKEGAHNAPDSQGFVYALDKPLPERGAWPLDPSQVKQMYDFVDSLETVDFPKYSLIMSYPKKVLGEDTHENTLADAGIIDAALMIQPED